MKTIKVVAAVIKKQNKVFVTQRGYGEFKDGWEFPGGKIEQGETPQEALKREIKEELDAGTGILFRALGRLISIEVGKLIDIVEYDYPTFHLSMQCFWCELKQDKIELKEHEAAKWLNLNEKEMLSVEWLPADRGLIKKDFVVK